MSHEEDAPMVEAPIGGLPDLARSEAIPPIPGLIEGPDVQAVFAEEAGYRLAQAEWRHRKRVEAGEVQLMDRMDLGGAPCAICGARPAVLGRGRDGVWRCELCTVAAGFETSVFEMVRKVGAEEA